MTSFFIGFGSLCLGLSAAFGLARAQEAGQNKAPPRNYWVAECTSAGREAPADCLLEQRLVVTETDNRLGVRAGNVLGAVRIRVPAKPRKPTMTVHLPQNLFLPAGVALRVDDGKALQLSLQTCDARGCYAGLAVSAELLESLKKGAQLHLGIQTMLRERIGIIVPLKGFTAGYRKIK
jgi:invasion protein IalB